DIPADHTVLDLGAQLLHIGGRRIDESDARSTSPVRLLPRRDHGVLNDPAVRDVRKVSRAAVAGPGTAGTAQGQREHRHDGEPAWPPSVAESGHHACPPPCQSPTFSEVTGPGGTLAWPPRRAQRGWRDRTGHITSAVRPQTARRPTITVFTHTPSSTE